MVLGRVKNRLVEGRMKNPLALVFGLLFGGSIVFLWGCSDMQLTSPLSASASQHAPREIGLTTMEKMDRGQDAWLECTRKTFGYIRNHGDCM